MSATYQPQEHATLLGEAFSDVLPPPLREHLTRWARLLVADLVAGCGQLVDELTDRGLTFGGPLPELWDESPLAQIVPPIWPDHLKSYIEGSKWLAAAHRVVDRLGSRQAALGPADLARSVAEQIVLGLLISAAARSASEEGEDPSPLIVHISGPAFAGDGAFLHLLHAVSSFAGGSADDAEFIESQDLLRPEYWFAPHDSRADSSAWTAWPAAGTQVSDDGDLAWATSGLYDLSDPDSRMLVNGFVCDLCHSVSHHAHDSPATVCLDAPRISRGVPLADTSVFDDAVMAAALGMPAAAREVMNRLAVDVERIVSGGDPAADDQVLFHVDAEFSLVEDPAYGDTTGVSPGVFHRILKLLHDGAGGDTDLAFLDIADRFTPAAALTGVQALVAGYFASYPFSGDAAVVCAAEVAVHDEPPDGIDWQITPAEYQQLVASGWSPSPAEIAFAADQVKDLALLVFHRRCHEIAAATAAATGSYGD